MELKSAELGLITGTCGSGKSFWLRCLAGLEPIPDDVSVYFDGSPWSPMSQNPKDIWFIPDNPQGVWVGQTCQEEMAFGHSSFPDAAQMEASLVQWGLNDVPLHQPCRSLNRVQALRLSLASMSLMPPRLLLMDNPTASLPLDEAMQIRHDVQAWARQSSCIVLVGCNRWEEWQDVVSHTWWTVPETRQLSTESPE